MLSHEEKKILLQRAKDVKVEISRLKNDLNSADSQKDGLLEKSDSFEKELSVLIRTSVSLRDKRNYLTKKVKELKAARDTANTALKEKLDELKNLRTEEKEIIKKYHIEFSPAKVKAEIDMLELKVETEGLSFEKEKAVMKKIKELRKKYGEAKELGKVTERISALSKEVKELKEKAQDAHKQVQGTARESQKRHEEMIANSAKIDELKKKAPEFSQEFDSVKKKFFEANDQLKAKLLELNEINQKLGEDKKEFFETKKDAETKTLKKKGADVEEKIKKRQKLTTEDLLVFQKMNK